VRSLRFSSCSSIVQGKEVQFGGGGVRMGEGSRLPIYLKRKFFNLAPLAAILT